VHLKEITGTLGSELSEKKIALCVTASISITEAPRIARILMRHGAEVIVVMTPRACEFVSPMIFEWSTGNAPITKLTGRVEHVELVSGETKVDLILVAPCTANTMAKFASGISDEPVSTLLCTALGGGLPILLASAMHEPMLRNPVVQEAKAKLEKAGVKFIEGELVESKSKLALPEEIVRAVTAEIGARQEDHRLAGHSLIITAGPTREPIDEIRYISNPSSGKMGLSLAEEALSMGAKRVRLIHGPGVVLSDALDDRRVSEVAITTTKEMHDAVLSALSSGKFDVLIAAGAPADYTLTPSPGKISTTQKPTLKLELKASKKIIEEAKAKFPKTFVVAFKAEHGLKSNELVAKARRALQSSGAAMVVANDVGRGDAGFGSDYNEVVIVSRGDRTRKVDRATKRTIAREILRALCEEIRA
jgi:phosphopantothenoylcysteine decarboxylase / phosphopantothenate---cysteine ligase